MKNWAKKILGVLSGTAKTAANTGPTAAKAIASPPPKTSVRGPTAPTPPKQATKRNPLKDRLYGDLSLEQWPPPDGPTTGVPWEDFIAARDHLQAGRKELAVAQWRTVLATPGLESLHYLQAWFFLRQNEVRPEPEDAYKIYGVVAENGPSGVLIAAYEDGQARLYSDQGPGIVWNRPDDSLDSLIEAILLASWKIIEAVPPWKTAHISLAKSNINSIAVLTPSGFFIKTGAPHAFDNDPLTRPVTDSLGLLIGALRQKTDEAT